MSRPTSCPRINRRGLTTPHTTRPRARASAARRRHAVVLPEPEGPETTSTGDREKERVPVNAEPGSLVPTSVTTGLR
jgi:hypothetical protein